MDIKVKNAITSGVITYAKIEDLDSSAVLSKLETVFDNETAFMDKVAEMDRIFDDNQQFEELREVCFDLLMINFFAEDVQKLEEDYLESDEWESIEEETLDRGTELLNVFLYLRECTDAEVQPSLEDYLKEFLLVEEDEFQDEYRIYEQVIANQILVESDYSEIAKVANTVRPDEELYELFYPLVAFFYEPKPTEGQVDEFGRYASNKSLEISLYEMIINFNK
ncbi:MAG TPA: hypothetical protein PKA53_05865 [Sphingobacterium sp.]|nr:hypothetical protein [Sphingobacterium sp.]